MILKNVADQYIAVWIFKYDEDNDVVEDGWTGQVGNLTITIVKDGGTPVAATNSPTEVDSTNMPGLYALKLDTAETNCTWLDVTTVCSTAGATVWPARQFFSPELDWESLLGSNYSSSTDTLEEITDYFIANLNTVIQRGLLTTELSGTGWLSRVTEKARRWADESSLNTKFQPNDMLELLQESVRELYTELLAHDDALPLVRYNLAIVEDQDAYVLPPIIGQIKRLAYIDETTQRPDFLLTGSTPYDPSAIGILLEGNTLTLTNRIRWFDGQTLQLLYIPSGDVVPHLGKLGDASTQIDSDDDAITIKESEIIDGTLDRRPNAYAGYMFRHLPTTSDIASSKEEELIPISSSTLDATNGQVVLNLRRPLNSAPASGTMGYEIVPVFWKVFEDVLAVSMARAMVMTTTNKKKYEMLTQKYREKARSLRLLVSKIDAMTAGRFDNRTYWNEDLIAFGSHM